MPLTITIELGPHATALLLRMEKKMADLTQAINDLTGAVGTTSAELTTLVVDLKAALAAEDPAAIQAAADAIEAQVKVLNDATAAAKAADPAQTPPTSAA